MAACGRHVVPALGEGRQAGTGSSFRFAVNRPQDRRGRHSRRSCGHCGGRRQHHRGRGRAVGQRPPIAPRFLSLACRPDPTNEPAHFFGGRRGIGRSAGRGADRCDQATPRRAGPFSCVGGAHMAAEGVPSLFPLGDLAIIGFAAIPTSLPKILRRIRETADAVVSAKPDALVIIDSPEFTHRVAQARAGEAAGNPDRRLCLSLGMGVASGPRARDASLCRSCARRCCRSSRKSWPSLAVRPALMLVIRWSNVSTTCVRKISKKGCACGPAACFWFCRAAVKARSARMAPCSVRRLRACVEQFGPIEVVVPAVPRLAETGAGSRVARGQLPARVVTEAEEKAEAFRDRRARRSASRALRLSNSRLPACRWLPATRFH